MFAIRGPLRTLTSADDFAPPYAATRAFLAGDNPYEEAALVHELKESGRERGPDGQPSYNPSLYPPPTFVALVPFAPMRWPLARVAFLVVTLALFAWHIPALLGLAGLQRTSDTALWLVAGTLALAPYHTGIALGQLAIPCVALLVIALHRMRAGDGPAAGVLLAIATLLKPQIAAPFILLAALRGGRRTAITASGLCIIAAAGSLAWLALHDVPWLASWRDVTASIQVAGGPADPAGPLSAQMVDLRPLLALTGLSATTAAGIVITGLLAVGLWWSGRRLDAGHDLLLMSGVAVLTLFVTYHRFYDAALLSLPLAWALSANAPRALRAGVIFCVAVFFVPGAWTLQVLADRGAIPAGITQSVAWNWVLLRHQNWALVAAIVLLLAAVRLARPHATPRSGNAA